MSVAAEEGRIQYLFEQVEGIEAVARTLAERDERRTQLFDIAEKLVAAAGAIRPVIAASLLGLSDKTGRKRAHEGVLKATRSGTDLTTDPLPGHEGVDPVR